MSYEHGYNHPAPEELAREVAEEGRIREEMAAEYERERVASMIAELEALGYTVTKGYGPPTGFPDSPEVEQQ